MSYQNIPYELRALPQWVCWKLIQRDGLKPTKIPVDPRTGDVASVTDPATWSDFETAVRCAQQWSGIGFVFTKNDPYCGIDLDDTHGDSETYNRQIKVFQQFASYSELSPSGNGLHIIVKAKLPGKGRRRAAIEMYDAERYFTFTGNIHDNRTVIVERQELAELLYEQMGGPVQTYSMGEDKPEIQTDEQIITVACTAANGEKFQQLFAGQWDLLYPSQSEADFALIDIIAHYTQNRAQIVRLFAKSGLGKAPKGNYKHRSDRVDYVSYMVEKSFDRQLPPVDVDGLRLKLEQMLEASSASGKLSGKPDAPASASLPVQTENATSNEQIASSALVSTCPPGLVGEIAKFIYASAPRPVPEIAIAAAFGLMAGICGRQYNISGTGLNQYILLIADTGRGKEAISNGISKLMRAVYKSVPGASTFEGPVSIASPQALHKAFKDTPCFYSIVGEFGLMLKQMSNPHAPPHLTGLKAAMLDLYHKSGAGAVLGSMIYSKKEDSTAVINSPAFTLIGESTPLRFFENVDEDVVTDGLLPRFTLFEYLGDQVPMNKARARVEPSFALVQMLAELCAHVGSQAALGNVTDVAISKDAEAIFDRFEEYARHLINNCDPHTGQRKHGKPNSVVTELWNRAHLKAMRLAGLIAVGINYHTPTVTAEIAQVCTDEIYWQTMRLKERFDRGEVGGGAVNAVASEDRQAKAMIKAIAGFAQNQFKGNADKYRMSEKMHRDKVFPFNSLLMRLQVYPAFKNDRRGASEAIRRTYQALIDNDDLREIPKQQMQKDYGKSCRAFMIHNVELFVGDLDD